MTSIADAVARAVLSGTKDYAAIKKKQERDRRQAERLQERYFRGHNQRVTIRDAAFAVMAEAYRKASGGGRYAANARQVMYAARPDIQEETGETLDDAYFTQTLLPDYLRAHPEETADWDIVYDARGHLWEPHTGTEIALGTLGVRDYLRRLDDPLDFQVAAPTLSGALDTSGPHCRYGAILYIEKEGFLPLLQQAHFAERYDLAIMSSKGMGTTAVRTLIESLFERVTILVLHDFDKSGFSILGTLTRDTRRYKYEVEPNVVDLGLRLRDVEEWKLQSEKVRHSSNPTENLLLNGATDEEVEFLRGKPYGAGYCCEGQRVELNAFTSDQFVAWLESKLQHHKIAKVIPDQATLEKAYRRAAGLRRYRQILAEANRQVKEYTSRVKAPRNLRSILGRRLRQDPTESWDEALEHLVKAQG